MNKTIYDYFNENVKLSPNKTAIVCGDANVTYGELKADTDSLAYALRQIGVNAKSRIALFINNSETYASVLLAVSFLGAAVMPLPTGFRPSQRQIAISRVECEFAVGLASVIEQLKNDFVLPPENMICIDRRVEGCFFLDDLLDAKKQIYNSSDANPTDDYILTMTSGSTGEPKPIVFSQQTKIDRAFKATKELYNLSKDDVVLVSTPLYHSLAQRSLLMPLMIGAKAVILPKFTPGIWLDSVQKEKISFLFAVSSQLESILRDLCVRECDLSSLKTVISSSALLKNETKLALLEHFECDIREIYGASEIGVATELSIKYEKNKYGSVGRALPFVKIKICDDDRAALTVWEAGEIACQSETRFVGYYGNPTATDAALDKEGYFYTGDIGMLDEDGYLYYLGRKKDIIITGGINVYPKDIEDVLLAVDGVIEAAVIGVDDAHFGEAIVAVVVSNEGVTKRELQRACAKSLADYQQPLAYEFVESLPKNDMGKLMRFKLKEMYAEYDATKEMRNLMAKRGSDA